MAVPPFHVYFLPILLELDKKTQLSKRELFLLMKERLNLTNEDLLERTRGGKDTRHRNRVSWATTYLKKSGLIISTARSVFSITDIGRKLASEKRSSLSKKDLAEFQSFVDFQKRSPSGQASQTEGVREIDVVEEDLDPKESLLENHETINKSLASDLLDAIMEKSPEFFEHLVLDVLESMGYGGKFLNRGDQVISSVAGGINETIDRDSLGLEQIFIRAKSYSRESPVPISAVHEFLGVLTVKHAVKGVFFTTSTFSESAIEAVKESGKRVILIDGDKLARLMIKHQIGVLVEETIHLGKLDSDYFDV